MRQSLFLYTNNERGRIPAPSDNSVNLPFTSAYILFLSVRSEGRDGSLGLSYVHSFSCRRKRSLLTKGMFPCLFFLVNVPFTYAIYFFFLRGQKEKVPKRKKTPPETDLALLRLPMTARQIRYTQTPLVPVSDKLRIRSSTGRHARNGRCWQSCNVDFAWLLRKQHLSRKNVGEHRLIYAKAIGSITSLCMIIRRSEGTVPVF